MKRVRMLLLLSLGMILAASLGAMAENEPLGKIIYASGGFSWHEIKMIADDGSGVTQLTSLGMDCYHPVWSPDGTRIALAVWKKKGSARSAEIGVMNADGSNLVYLTDNKDYDTEPSWSPDGTKIIFVSERDSSRGEIYVMDADGSNVVRLTKNKSRESSPCWSPDGSKILFSSRPDGYFSAISVMDADGTNVKILSSGNFHQVSPRWSPDGTRIAYCTYSDSSAANQAFLLLKGGIRIMTAEGMEQKRIHGTVSGDSNPSWAPDGKRIAFDRMDRMMNWEIYIGYPDEETDPVNITKDPKNRDTDPDWCWR